MARVEGVLTDNLDTLYQGFSANKNTLVNPGSRPIRNLGTTFGIILPEFPCGTWPVHLITSTAHRIYQSLSSNSWSGDKSDHESSPTALAGRMEMVSAKYLIGSDGAYSQILSGVSGRVSHSQLCEPWPLVRRCKALSSTSQHDIHTRAAIHSLPMQWATFPVLMHRPEHCCVRLGPGACLDCSRVTPESTLETARTILSPDTLTLRELNGTQVMLSDSVMAESFA
ncbi:hypothetical protein JB92DRAFT_2829616 [Gautieria morchelliformis]|nr:hypothetical protein JB92DRAFT_2829616 [Gautieria morchelliformis]